LREGDFEFVDNVDAKRSGHQKLIASARRDERTAGRQRSFARGSLSACRTTPSTRAVADRALDPATQPPEIRAFLQAEIELLDDVIADAWP